MTYQQAIAEAIRLFLTTDVDAVTTAAATGSGLSFFCPSVATVTDAEAVCLMVTPTVDAGSSFFCSSVATVCVALTTTPVVDADADFSFLFTLSSEVGSAEPTFLLPCILKNDPDASF